MKTPYNIFKKEYDGSMRWLGHTSDLQIAESCIAQLLEHSPGQYFVFDGDVQKLATSSALAAKPVASGQNGQ